MTDVEISPVTEVEVPQVEPTPLPEPTPIPEPTAPPPQPPQPPQPTPEDAARVTNVLNRYTDRYITMHSALENIPVNILYEYLVNGQLFAPENFEENYSKWPKEIQDRWGYEPVKMSIDDQEEIVGYVIHRKYVAEQEAQPEQETQPEAQTQAVEPPPHVHVFTAYPEGHPPDQVEEITEEVKKTGRCIQQ